MKPGAGLAALLRACGGRAIGVWVVHGDELRIAAFDSSPELSSDVARRFTETSASVGLSQTTLGIVRAVLIGEPVVSIAADLHPETGSGLWLRAFGAERSIAVPIRGDNGGVRAVISVATSTDRAANDAIVEALRSFAAAMDLD